MKAGVVLPQYDIDFASGRPDPGHVVSLALRAERLGFESVWLSDHPWVVAPDGSVSGALDPLAMIGAVAARSTRICVGTLTLAGSLLAPGTIADLCRSLELLCPGRGIVGLGAGWNPVVHEALGVRLTPYTARADHLRHLCVSLRSASPGTELLVGGWGEAVLEIAAEFADTWNVAWDVAPNTFLALSSRLTECCERLGRDPALVCRSVGLHVLPAAGPAAVEAVLDRLRARAGWLAGVDRAEVEARAIVGDAASCAERLAAYGADEIVLSPLVKDDPELLDEIGTEILPLLPLAEPQNLA